MYFMMFAFGIAEILKAACTRVYGKVQAAFFGLSLGEQAFVARGNGFRAHFGHHARAAFRREDLR